MKTIEEGRSLTVEIAELLQNATREQKLVVKGVLLVANEFDKEPVDSDEEIREEVPK